MLWLGGMSFSPYVRLITIVFVLFHEMSQRIGKENVHMLPLVLYHLKKRFIYIGLWIISEGIVVFILAIFFTVTGISDTYKYLLQLIPISIITE